MSRLGKIRPGARFDLEEAFRFLGKAPSHRDLGLAAEMLRESGVEVVYDQDLQDLAIENSSSAIVALDLHSAFYFGVEALSAGPRKQSRSEDEAD